ncbi:glycosyltransferase [Flavobacterium sp. KMS]|uniref:glycosyltransferase n=1 Tax=unclassified Flavobacterium TaxID=196869 RepID=UPI00057D8295|nr:glycosyltransferase [Flavobacterium sp. KMS]KIA99797.1 group 1 glycosyl transferase [Flavobacterium sp. KMS]
MRILQIIDSLETGGAERMAVNYANKLAEKIEFSGLIATRKEGLLLRQIAPAVSYLFLNKRLVIDFKAIFLLRNYVVKNSVTIIHAHSSSFFIAMLLKLTLPKIKIIWHDHYGISQDLSQRKNWSLKFGSFFFTGIVSVNSALKEWARSYLLCSNVIYLSNFIESSSREDEDLALKGIEGKRIICVANLRPQKNHKLLIDVARIIKKNYPEWTFHLFGKDFEDDYSKEIKHSIEHLNLKEQVFFYGSTNTISSSLKQCDIGILTSRSEGLPLAILEYGLYNLAVVATDVGEISKVIISGTDGVIVESNNLNEFVDAIEKLIRDEKYREELSLKLKNKIEKFYSGDYIISQYLSWMVQ